MYTLDLKASFDAWILSFQLFASCRNHLFRESLSFTFLLFPKPSRDVCSLDGFLLAKNNFHSVCGYSWWAMLKPLGGNFMLYI